MSCKGLSSENFWRRIWDFTSMSCFKALRSSVRAISGFMRSVVICIICYFRTEIDCSSFWSCWGWGSFAALKTEFLFICGLAWFCVIPIDEPTLVFLLFVSSGVVLSTSDYPLLLIPTIEDTLWIFLLLNIFFKSYSDCFYCSSGKF